MILKINTNKNYKYTP